MGYNTKKNSKAVLSHRFNLFLKCLTSLTSSNMSKKRLRIFFLPWDSEGSIFFVLRWICLIFSHKCSIGICSSHGIGEILNWLLPLLSEGLNFEKIEEKFLRTARNTYYSLVSQKTRQNQITYFKSTRKISLAGIRFWNPVMTFLGRKIRFQKRRKFSYFWLCPPAKLPKFEQWIWFSYICCFSVNATQRVLYLSNL